MSRREEVENEIDGLDIAYSANFYTDSYANLARTLAVEVDLLRASLRALGEKATRYEHEREVNAGLVAERDAVITKLLDMLADNTPGRIHGVSYYTDAQNKQAELYNRALEIAGRNG